MEIWTWISRNLGSYLDSAIDYLADFDQISVGLIFQVLKRKGWKYNN